MIFFRSLNVEFCFRKDQTSYVLFGKLKAFYAGPVDEQSGMVVNLKNVDIWLNQSHSKAPAFKNKENAIQYYFETLKNDSILLQKIEIESQNESLSFDGTSIERKYRFQTWLLRDKTWVQRSVILISRKPLSIEVLRKLSTRKWSSAALLVKKFKLLFSGLRAVEIEMAETSTTQIFQF